MTERLLMARHDPALALAGLFRPLQAKSERPRLVVTKTFDGMELEWRAPVAPGIPEQTLLLTLLALAQQSSRRLTSEPQTPIGRQLRVALAAEGELFAAETASIMTTLSELAQHCGYAQCGGSTLERIRVMLRCLAEITVWVRIDGYEASSRLLSVVMDSSGRARIALNTRLAMAAWGERYVSISLVERHALNTHTAQALHAYLSAVIRPGKQWSFEWNSLERAVWGACASGSTQRSRRKKLREALTALVALGWTIAGGAKVTVVRQSDNGSPS